MRSSLLPWGMLVSELFNESEPGLWAGLTWKQIKLELCVYTGENVKENMYYCGFGTFLSVLIIHTLCFLECLIHWWSALARLNVIKCWHWKGPKKVIH